jgi:flagellar hook protein FlgE
MNVNSIAYSGIVAAKQQLSVSANNVANSDTESYEAQRLNIKAVESGSVTTSPQEYEDPKELYQRDGHGPDHSNIDLAAEFIEQIRAKMAIDMNAKAIHAANDMVGNLINEAV